MRSLPAPLRDPLLQYLVIGLLLTAAFLVFRGGTDPEDTTRRIEVDAAQIQWLHQAWQARWQRPPTAVEMRGLIDDRVRQEVLYRTGLAMGLDRDDEVFRRRIQQKVEMMTEDFAAGAVPLESDLQAFMIEHLDDYRFPERRSFTHIFLNYDERGESAYATAETLRATLQANPATGDRAAELGDRFMLERAFEYATLRQVSRTFGETFAEGLFALPAGSWQGPIFSGYGLHLVRVSEVVPGREPELAEVRDVVLRDYSLQARDRARTEVYANLVENYTIEIDEDALQALPVTPEPDGADR